MVLKVNLNIIMIRLYPPFFPNFRYSIFGSFFE